MGRSIVAFAAVLSLFSSFILAQNIPKCGPGSPCPASAPCCSQYGQCGVGAYCLGGCDPLFSHKLTSCVPAPVCSSADYQLNSLDNAAPINKYLGDASNTNWVYSGTPATYQGDSLLLTMAQDTVGTLIASTRYVWYGKISATLSTSQGAGVVTAFIMMSDVKDEIDFEFVGTDLEHAQSNFYSQGVTNYNNGANLSTSNTLENTHTYTIDWQPDQITWAIDGNVMRTVKRDSTWNATANRFDFPQTPSRIMLSLWPAGLPSNGAGTIAWGGGLVDWNSPLMQNGYYYARVHEVKVDCYDPPPGANINGRKSYIYTDAAGTNNTVQITDKLVTLASLQATGEDPGVDPDASQSSSASGTSTASSSASTSAEPESVPGMVGAGGMSEDTTSLAGGDSGAAPTGAAGGQAGSGQSGGNGGFSQGGSSQGANSGADVVKVEKLGGSVIAILIAIAAVMVL
ncbi:glycoside hydrolase family 16 protein [Aulographum hederae CBS 113979]|uniref:Crh-like protein n=1 Tax=Aulographum hederae CBS 113979 TaxID=1176131 RepID=A0A6G1GJD9_9PEZI|nr:glycoside hydrolase family 16 protein [Aulographum hederae CBS 113979]